MATESSLSNVDRVLARLARSDAIGSGTLETAFAEITEAAAKMLDVRRVNVWLFDELQTKIQCVENFDLLTGTHSRGGELLASEHPKYFEALKQRRTIAANDARTDVRTAAFAEYLTKRGIASLLDAPIYTGGEMTGVLCHEHIGAPRQWTLDEQHFAASCADFASLTLEADRRRRSEQSLQQSERQFRRAMLEAPCPVMIHADDGEIRLINNIWTEITGYTLDDIPTIADWTEKAYGEDKQSARARIDRLYNAEDYPTGSECAIRTKQGETRVWEFSSSPLGSLPDGRRLVISVGVDLTDRKRAEKSTAELARIVTSSSDAIIGQSIEGRILSWNQAAEKVFGYTADEMIGQSVEKLSAPEQSDELLALLDRLQLGESVVDHELSCARKDGQAVDVALTISPIADAGGTLIGGSTIARDISRRKQTERALRDNESRLRLLLDQIPAILWTTDRELRFTSSTGSGLTRLRLRPNEVVGSSLYDFFQSNDETVPAIARSLRALAGESSVFEERWAGNSYQAYIEPMYDADGQLLGTIGVALDITRRKETEENLRHLNESLEDKVAERTVTVRAYADELKRQTEELKRSNEELDQFVSTVTHDLRAPLRAITTYCELLRTRYGESLDETASEFMTGTVTAVHCMDRLIDDLCEYARVQTHAEPPSRVSFENALSDALVNLTSEIRRHDAQITHDPLPVLNADRTQIMQLLQNLIDNALKYRSDETPQIHISAELNGSEWIFRIRDNGIGIDPKFAERVFKIFVRIRPGEGDGTGLGLAICQRIVERHGGRIWVEPGTDRKGSVFCFTMPKS